MAEESEDRSKSKSFFFISRSSDFLRFQLYFWLFFFFCLWGLSSAFWGNGTIALGMSLFMIPSYYFISQSLRISYSKLQVKGVFIWKTLVIVFLLAVAGSLLLLYIAGFGIDFLDAHDVVPEGKNLIRFVFHWVVLATWSLVYLSGVADAATRVEEKRKMEALRNVERAELQVLRFQLNPHFMFNSLNNVITEIQDRPHVALEMTHRLASYLRYTLEFRNETLVPLSHEIAGMRKYLEIEKDRFGKELKYEEEIAEGLDECKIPVFLLQPIFENAVNHGLNSQKPPWLISLKIEGDKSQMMVQVSSNGQIKSDADKKGLGLGLDVVRRRLDLHYPRRSEFELTSGDGVVVAMIKLEGEPCLV